MIKRTWGIQAKLLLLMVGIIILTASIFVWFFIAHERNFLLSLGIPPPRIEIFVTRISQNLALILSLIIIFSIVILLFFIKKILFPILKLSSETRMIVGGNLDYPISVETEDEIGEIAKDFKVLEKSLKATIRDLRKRSKEIEALLKATTSMATKLNSQEILKLAMEYITSFLGYDYVLISQLSEDKKETINHIFSGEKEIQQAIEDIIEMPISSVKASFLDLPFIQELYKGKIIIKKELRELIGKAMPESACDAIQVLIGAKSFINIPLLIKENIAYFLLISSPKEEIAKTDLDALSIFIHHAGLALENVKLHQEKALWIEELERTVEEKTKELEVVHKKISHQEKIIALGTMAGRMAHELKNPLAIIRSNVYYLKKKIPKEFIKYLEMIGRAEERSNIVIDETMGFVKGVFLKRDFCNVNHIIEEVLRSLSNEIIKVDVIKELGENIPSIPLDFHWIHNLFVNIIINAVQAIEEKGSFYLDTQKRGIIKIKSSFIDNNVEVSISDSGGGVSSEIRNRVFDPFFGTKIRGTGLGLAICKEIADKHNGTISISDSEYKGACFTIRLPVNE